MPEVNPAPRAEADAAPVPIGLVVGDWLAFSETFIYDQVRHQSRTHCLVCAKSFTSLRGRFPYEDVAPLGWWERKAHKWLDVIPSWRRFLLAGHARLIHAHFGNNGARVLDLASELDVPLAVNFHGHDVAGLEPANLRRSRYFYYRKYGRRLFDQAALLLCPSTDLADTLVKEHGAPEAKIVVHRLGIDVDAFPEVERRGPVRRLLMVGRLVEKKGMDVGLRAMAELARDHPELEMTVVGAGPLASRLSRLARELGLAGRVRFTGALAPDAVCGEMKRADVLLAPSYRTPSGDRESGIIVVKEAAATGLPAVGTFHGGIPEIIDDGSTGFLVPERDVAGMAARLRVLVEDEPRCRAFGREAAAKMRREYDTRVRNERLEDLLLGLL